VPSPAFLGPAAHRLLPSGVAEGADLPPKLLRVLAPGCMACQEVRNVRVEAAGLPAVGRERRKRGRPYEPPHRAVGDAEHAAHWHDGLCRVAAEDLVVGGAPLVLGGRVSEGRFSRVGSCAHSASQSRVGPRTRVGRRTTRVD
jgi:hypothetical protein